MCVRLSVSLCACLFRIVVTLYMNDSASFTVSSTTTCEMNVSFHSDLSAFVCTCCDVPVCHQSRSSLSPNTHTHTHTHTPTVGKSHFATKVGPSPVDNIRPTATLGGLSLSLSLSLSFIHLCCVYVIDCIVAELQVMFMELPPPDNRIIRVKACVVLSSIHAM